MLTGIWLCTGGVLLLILLLQPEIIRPVDRTATAAMVRVRTKSPPPTEWGMGLWLPGLMHERGDEVA